MRFGRLGRLAARNRRRLTGKSVLIAPAKADRLESVGIGPGADQSAAAITIAASSARIMAVAPQIAWPLQLKGRRFERRLPAPANRDAGGCRIQQRAERQLDQLGDFGRIGPPVGRATRGGQPGRDREIAAKQIDRRQLAQELDRPPRRRPVLLPVRAPPPARSVRPARSSRPAG